MTEQEDRELVEALLEGTGAAILKCTGCGHYFGCDPEGKRAEPGLDSELIYCDKCNEEARQWCERVEANW